MTHVWRRAISEPTARLRLPREERCHPVNRRSRASGAVLWALMQPLLLRPRKRQFTVWPRVLKTESLFGGNLTFAHKSRTFPYFGRGEWRLSAWPTARKTITFTLVKQRRTVPPLVPPRPLKPFVHRSCTGRPISPSAIIDRHLIQPFSSPLHHVLSLLRWSHHSFDSSSRPERQF